MADIANQPLSIAETDAAVRFLLSACGAVLDRCDALRALGEEKQLWTRAEFDAAVARSAAQSAEQLARLAPADVLELLRQRLPGGRPRTA